jgi:hypothetical protein
MTIRTEMLQRAIMHNGRKLKYLSEDKEDDIFKSDLLMDPEEAERLLSH